MHRFHLYPLLACLVLIAGAPGASWAGFVQTNLVSDIPGLAAHTDANLKNPWGISFSSASPFWVSDQLTGKATLYNGAGTPIPLVVTIPPGGGMGSPTGQVFNPTADFVLPTGGRALFLFATLNGTLAGWNGAQGTMAVAMVITVGKVYTGLALANNGGSSFLYAANDAGGAIDVYNAMFAPVNLGGSFTDPNLPAGFTPYNIQNLGGTLFVTYENEMTGGGVVDAYDLNGNFIRRVTANGAGGPLDSPWGLALAPAGFGPFGGALLVGNEGDGHISAFNPTTGAFLGQLLDVNGQPLANTGLWGLIFGNGGNGGDPDKLYFAAGINDEANGLFGVIQVVGVPEPASVALLGLGGVVLALARYRRQKRGR